MKILYFGGGLGNQIFQYAFYLYLKNTFPNESIFGVYNKKKLSEHHGLEVNKWFKVELPKQTLFAKIIVGVTYVLKKIGIERFLDRGNGELVNTNAIVLNAYRDVYTYIPDGEWISFNVDEDALSPLNKEVLSRIRSTNSVFIHVRRGDYLSEFYKDWFEGTCPIEYYIKALKDIKDKVDNPSFFIFSDDIEWSKKNIKVDNSTYVNWNTGKNSPLDMFLMSQCKYAVMANSTFSFWGAVLGYKKKLIYYPSKWFRNSPVPDFIPKEWLTF